MKTISIILGCMIAIGALVHLYDGNSYEVVKNSATSTPEEVIKEVYPDWAENEEAVQAAKDVIRRQELEKELAELTEQNEQVEARMTEIEKELGTYWRDVENVKALIRQTFPEEPANAIAIANCESGLKPNAYNPNNPDGSTDGGLWQINSVHDKTLERLGLDKYDPEDATKYARMLYERNGWTDWVCAWHSDHLALVDKY